MKFELFLNGLNYCRISLPQADIMAALNQTGGEEMATVLSAGVDEAGRGPLAGPVTAAAVILPRRGIPRGLDDSKKLSPARRRQLAEQIKDCADWAIAHASVEEIGQLNIHYASHLAMRRAVAGLPLADFTA